MNLNDTHVWTPRATVAAVIERDGAFLMVEEDTEDGVRLNQPAGHLEPGESLAAAAIRETLEETAHVLQPVGLLGTYLWRTGGDNARNGTTYLRFAFVGTVGEPDPSRKLDVGIRRALWMTADALRACPALHRSPLVMQCVDHYLAGRASGKGWIPLTALHTHSSVSDAVVSDAPVPDASDAGSDR
ncbi:NUDIX hydrolase [Pigmentiphaga litoralis]|jgi:8-oxo-dGTP pyrophosphatase MutT (NUDIX family)|nr:NUDIX hydrolase [Pigmentiphaga litoralis]